MGDRLEISVVAGMGNDRRTAFPGLGDIERRLRNPPRTAISGEVRTLSVEADVEHEIVVRDDGQHVPAQQV